LASSVQPREVTFKKAGRTEVLALKGQDGAAGVAGATAAPGLVMPAAAGGNTSYAPFVARAAPKNGESDGL
jgi:general secretion pathway protein N